MGAILVIALAVVIIPMIGIVYAGIVWVKGRANTRFAPTIRGIIGAGVVCQNDDAVEMIGHNHERV